MFPGSHSEKRSMIIHFTLLIIRKLKTGALCLDRISLPTSDFRFPTFFYSTEISSTNTQHFSPAPGCQPGFFR